MNLGHVFEQGNIVLISVFLLLIGMSITSWYLIFWKSWIIRKERALLSKFKGEHVTMPDWPLYENDVSDKSNIALLFYEAQRVNASAKAHGEQSQKDILTMYLCQKLDNIRVKADSGLTILASIGSSAPFIGLFGTVWGIYGALISISAKGNAGLDAVAGPMGEALVATAVGLFAAIPAVLAYNAFVRINRVYIQDLRHIAEQLTIYIPLRNKPLKRNNSEPVRLVEGAR